VFRLITPILYHLFPSLTPTLHDTFET